MIVIPKNAREEVRVSRDDFNGYDVLNIRVWYRHESGEMRPSKKGLAVQMDSALLIADAIRKVSA